MAPIVLEAEPNLIAASHAERREVTGGARDDLRELAVGEGPVLVEERHGVRLQAPVPDNGVNEVHGCQAADYSFIFQSLGANCSIVEGVAERAIGSGREGLFGISAAVLIRSAVDY